jgi:hypothetical protein
MAFPLPLRVVLHDRVARRLGRASDVLKFAKKENGNP